jgi:hypothetical protein
VNCKFFENHFLYKTERVINWRFFIIRFLFVDLTFGAAPNELKGRMMKASIKKKASVGEMLFSK